MNNKLIPLHQVPAGFYGQVKKLIAEGAARRRLLDLGLINDTVVEVLRKSPAGDPTAYQIRGAVIALRSEEACKLFVEIIHD